MNFLEFGKCMRCTSKIEVKRKLIPHRIEVSKQKVRVALVKWKETRALEALEEEEVDVSKVESNNSNL